MGPIFHGLKLASGAYAENFHFERLAADPVPLSHGRIWFNTTDGLFKYSSLAQGGAVVTASFASAAELTASVAGLTAAVNAEIAARQSAISAEQTARAVDVALLNTAIADEIAARTAADAAEAALRVSGDATEAANRTAAIAAAAVVAADATATETVARLAGDAALGVRVDSVQAELDASQAGVGLNVDGSYTAPLNTAHLGLSTSVKEATALLDAALVAETTARQGADVAIGSAIANEAQLRADGDANLQTQLTAYISAAVNSNAVADAAESARAIAAEAALQAELDATQATVGTAPNGTLIPIVGTHYLDGATTVFGGAAILDGQVFAAHQAITAETAARALADVNFDSSLQAEITARTVADVAMQTEMNTTQAGAGLETNGAYLALVGSGHLDLATSLKDADAKLDAAVTAVENRATAIESVSIPGLQTQVTAEVNRATAAENVLTTAVGNANTAIGAEVARATAAEGTLTTGLSTEVTRATTAEASLQTQLNAVVAASGSGAAALQTQLNGKRYTYKSLTPALVHTINHGLNTEFYSATIMVKGTDGVYRNDIVPVEDIDLNSFRVTLSVSSDIKVSGQSNDQLA